jgi:hypothetical protein
MNISLLQNKTTDLPEHIANAVQNGASAECFSEVLEALEDLVQELKSELCVFQWSQVGLRGCELCS